MAKNPLLKRKFEEGYNKGIEDTVNFVAKKFAMLSETNGIGPKTAEKIKEVFGKEYFKEIE